MSASRKDGARQEADARVSPGTAAALTPRVGEPGKGCGDGKSHAGPDESSGAFPEGWQLGIESWSFHRQFFARVGRVCAQGEYTAILHQIRWHIAPKLDRYHYQVTLFDGASIIVDGGRQYLDGVEPADWTPPIKAVGILPTPSPPPEPQPTARAPPIAIATPLSRPPLRASTLTLKSPTAARLVAERLRKAGVSVGSASP
jgi:hypothetical protein